MNEEGWVLIRRFWRGFWLAQRHILSIGKPTCVEIAHEWALKREETHGDVCGFLHTHPSWAAVPSNRDDYTMRSWVLCFGKPLLCAIDGVDGLRGYWYKTDDGPPVEQKIFRIPFNIIVGKRFHGFK